MGHLRTQFPAELNMFSECQPQPKGPQTGICFHLWPWQEHKRVQQGRRIHNKNPAIPTMRIYLAQAV